jgi:tetratricopeptide (TPR) repeat protein
MRRSLKLRVMNWPMCTISANNELGETIRLDDGHRVDEAVFVGPSMLGTIYRSTQSPEWYRLVPIENASIEWRHSVSSQAAAAPQTIARSRKFWQQSFGNSTQLVFSYAANEPGQTLAELITSGEPAERLRGAACLVRALSQWWLAFSPPVFPLPADIVISDDGQARLLAIPRSELPNIQAVFARPQRLLYLAPEMLRSATNIAWDTASWQAMDSYAVGVCLLACFCELPSISQVESTLFRCATGSIFSKPTLRADFPAWLEQFPHHRNTLNLIRRLISRDPASRMSVDLKHLPHQLEQLREMFDPRTAVAWLRDQAKPKEALKLLQELLARAVSPDGETQQQYDLLCLAGELCARFLHQPLEAIDYFERAIGLDPVRHEAHREQLRIIAGARHHRALATLLDSHSSVSDEIDAKLWRNYAALFGNRTTYGNGDTEQMDDRLVASYVIWRRQFALARDFIYPRLFDDEQNYIWWDFDLGLAYVQSFFGLASEDPDNLQRATDQLQQIKSSLQLAMGSGLFEETQVHQYGEEVADLEYRIYLAKQNIKRSDS